MTLVRFNNRPATRAFNNLMDDFFTGMPSFIGNEGTNGPRPAPVNITETEHEFLLELVAPGLQKEDFKISLDQNTLTLSAEKKEETVKEGEKQIRREYRFQSFKRSFTLDEKIDAGRIVAKYLNGVLTVNLPKPESVKSITKEITIE